MDTEETEEDNGEGGSENGDVAVWSIGINAVEACYDLPPGLCPTPAESAAWSSPSKRKATTPNQDPCLKPLVCLTNSFTAFAQESEGTEKSGILSGATLGVERCAGSRAGGRVRNRFSLSAGHGGNVDHLSDNA